MSIRVTTILVIAVTTLALVGLLLLSLNATLLPHFERQQEQTIYLSLQRAQSALDSELEHLEQTARDWAKWDDTYAFVQNSSPAYIQANLQDETFIDLGLNLMLMADLNGKVVFEKYFDLQTGQPAALPADLRAQVLDVRLLNQQVQRGVLMLSGGPMLLVAHPILQTAGVGPAIGTLILGRSLDAAETARLANSAQLQFQILSLAGLPAADAAALQTLQSGQAYTINNLNDQTAVGHILLKDIFGQPAALIRLEQQRSIYKNGALLVNYLFTALLMSALTFAVILYLILEMTVLTRMRRLSREMAGITRSADLSQRVTVARSDEITSLSRSINAMLTELESSQAGLRSLSRRLVQVQEEERRQIALELHDEIGQILTGMKLQMQGGARLPADELLPRMQRAEEMINELIGRVRQMSLNLRPSMLDDLGLLPTLVWHIERYTRQTNIQVALQQSNLEGQRFPFDVETAAYRVIQEALTNAARHAQVKQVTVRAWLREGWLGLQVEDDGAGFNYADVLGSSQSRGLVGMRERVSTLRGTLEVDTAPGRGTCITVEIPIEDEHEH